MSHQIEKTALVMHSAQRMFHLVNDIHSYPEFLPWCAGAEIHQRSDSEIMASLDVAKGGMHHRLTTRNQLVEPDMIDMTLVDGPFRNLCGHWKFLSLDTNACKVVLRLEFEFSGSLSKMTFGAIFNQAANTMVDAFCRRADVIYRGAAGMIDVEIAYATPEKQKILTVSVEENTTVFDAVLQSGIQSEFPEIDLESVDMGVFGKVVKAPKKDVLRAGDRVELYRPLKIDPKQARLNRAKKKA